MSVAMEQFFTPTRRYQDLFELGVDDHLGPFEYTEKELVVPVEEFLACNLDWKYLWALLTAEAGATQKILWITEDAFLVAETQFYFHNDGPGCSIKADFHGTSGQEQSLILACNDESIGAADVFWRAIITSNSIQMAIGNYSEYSVRGLLPSGPLLPQFFRQSSSLQVLEFCAFLFEEEHCCALATLQRTDLKVELTDCKLHPQDAEDTFIEWFRHNKILTELNYCQIKNSLLSALSGNNSVKKLTLRRHPREITLRRHASEIADEEQIRYVPWRRRSQVTWV
jgi:hypothetical protein